MVCSIKMTLFPFNSIIIQLVLLTVCCWCGIWFFIQNGNMTYVELHHNSQDSFLSDNFAVQRQQRKLAERDLNKIEDYQKINKEILSNSIDSFFMSRTKNRRRPSPKSFSHVPKEVLERIGLRNSSKSHVENLLINIGKGYNNSNDQNYFSSLTTSRIFQPLPPNSQATADNSSCKLFDAESTVANTNHHLILVFVDSRYFPLYHNWHLHFIDICGHDRISQLELVCMDEEVINSLSSLGLKCSTHSFVIPSGTSAGMYAVKRQASIWIKRMEVILFYLQQGMDLLLTDTDAIWRSDPYVDLNRLYSSADIIASKGSFPGTLFQSWGATICMGYIFLKSSPFSTMFMNAVLLDMRLKGAVMERIQEEIVVRQRLLPQNEVKAGRYLGRKSNLKKLMKEKTMDFSAKSKKYRTKGTLPTEKSLENFEPEQRRKLFLPDFVKEEDAPEEPDIPDHSNIADNLGADEDMEPSSKKLIETKTTDNAGDDEDEDNEEDEIDRNKKYSSSDAASWTNWIRSNDVSVYLPAIKRFHSLLLAHKLSELFPTHNATQDEERRNLDILHFLYDVRDLEGNKPDDQYAVNYALFQWQIKWDRKPMQVVEGKYFATDHGTVLLDPAQTHPSYLLAGLHRLGRMAPLVAKKPTTINYINGSVLLLPHYTYLRNCTGIPYNRRTRSMGYRHAKLAVARKDVIVAHCLLSPGDAKKKYLSLKSFKLWHKDAPRVTSSFRGISLFDGSRNISSYAEALYTESKRAYGKSKMNITSIRQEREKAYRLDAIEANLAKMKSRMKERRKKKLRRNHSNNP